MIPTITLFQRVPDEFAPRYYRLTGPSYPDLLAAVKALSGSEWAVIEGAWLVGPAAVRTLRAWGHTVEQEADFRYTPFHPTYDSVERVDAATMSALVMFEYRNKDGEWYSLRGKMIRFPVAPGEEPRKAAAEHVAHYGKRVVALWQETIGQQRSAEAIRQALAVIEQHLKQTAPLSLVAL